MPSDLGCYLRNDRVVALAAIRAGEVDDSLGDLRSPAQLDPGVAVFLVTEGEADVLEAGRETDAAANGRWRMADGVWCMAYCRLRVTRSVTLRFAIR